MSEDNQAPESPKSNTELPKFELPKAAAPSVSAPAAAPRVASPVTPLRRPANFGASTKVIEDTKAENPAWIVVDFLAAAVSVAFAVLIFLDK